ncbi:MAG: translocation/assembly module TamB domain-containing protein [Deltaproteobacteria bacterium]|nr:translocation/assembly module TamB domain-containing protein [Deltaproteobacteria bacterium]
MSAPPRRRRWIWRILGAVGVVPLGLGGAGVVYLRTPAGNELIRTQTESLVTGTMGEGKLTIGQLSTDLFTRVELGAVKLTDGAGREVIGVDAVRAEIALWPMLLRRAILVRSLDVSGARGDLQVDESGALDLSRMFPSDPNAPDEPWGGLPVELILERVSLRDVSVAYDDGVTRYEVSPIDLDLAGNAVHKRFQLNELQLNAEILAPAAGPLTLAGSLIWDDGDLDLSALHLTVAGSSLAVSGEASALLDEEGTPNLDLTVNATRLDLDALEVLTGDLGLSGALATTLKVEGPLSSLGVKGGIQAPVGEAVVDVVLNVEDARLPWSGVVTTTGLDVGSFVDAVTETTVLTAEVRGSGAGLSWPDDLTAEATVSLADAVAWGYAVPEAQATVSLKNGRATLTGVRYATDWGVATGTGWIGETNLDLDLKLNVWRLSGLEALDVTDLAGDARGSGRLRVDWGGEDAEVDFDGALQGRSLAYAEDVVMGAWSSPDVVVRYDGSGTHVEGTLDAEAVSSTGMDVALLSGPYIVDVDPDGVVDVAVEAHGEGLNYDVLTVDVMDGLVELRYAEERLELTGTFTLEGAAYPPVSGEQGTMALGISGDDLTIDLRLRDGDVPAVIAVGGGNLATDVWAFEQIYVGDLGGVAWQSTQTARFTLTDGGVKDAAVELKSEAGVVRATGQLGTSGPLDGLIHAEGLSLAWVATLAPESLAGWTGLVDLDVILQGDAAAPTMLLGGSVKGLGVPGQVAGVNARIDAKTDGDALRLNAQLADREGALVTLAGLLPVSLDLTSPALLPEGATEGRVTLLPTGFERLARAFPAVGELPEGRGSAELVWRGTPLAPVSELRAGLHVPTGETNEWIRLDLNVNQDGDSLTTRAEMYERGQRRVELDGEAEAAVGAFTRALFADGPEVDTGNLDGMVSSFSARVVPVRVPTEALGLFVELPEDLRGFLSGGLVVSGRPSSPQVEGALLLIEGGLGELEISPAIMSLSPVEGGYSLLVTAGFIDPSLPPEEGATDVTLAGFVPFVLDAASGFDMDAQLAREGLDLTVSGAGLPVAALRALDPAILRGRGALQVNGVIKGSLTAPQPDVTLTLNDASLVYRDLKLDVQGVHLDAQLTAEALTIREARAKISPADDGATGAASMLLATGDRPASEGCAAGLTRPDPTTGEARKSPVPLDAPLSPGELYAAGTVQLDALSPSTVDLQVCGNKVWVSATRDERIQVTTDLGLTGPYPNLLLRGSLRSDTMTMRFEESDFFEAGALRLDPALVVVRGLNEEAEAELVTVDVAEGGDADPTAPVGVSELVGEEVIAAAVTTVAPTAEPSFYELWDIRLNVDLNRQAFLDVTLPMLDAYDALGLSTITLQNSQLDGVLDVRMLGEEIDATGEVTILRGEILMMNKSFGLQDGLIIFSGQPIDNPNIEIVAVHKTQSHGDISVNVSQSAEAPNVSFTSDEGYSITSILSILLTGQSAEDLGTTGAGAMQQIGTFLSSQAGGVLSSKASSASKTSLIDSLSFGSLEDQLLSDIKVGTSVGDRGFLELQWNLGASAEENGGSQTEISFEYAFTRRLEGEIHIGNDRSADVYYTIRF